jgi:hypothetical protein
MSDGIAGNPTTLTGATQGAIGNLRSITLPNMERVFFDTSSMSSTNDWRTFLGGMIDAGEATFELVFDKAVVVTLHSAIVAVNEVWTILFSNGSTWACSGGVKSQGGGSSNIDDTVIWNLTIKFSGEPTFTAN